MSDAANPDPDVHTLFDWAEGRLEPAHADRVAAQVAADPRARATVEWLGGFLAAARALPLREPPPVLRQNLSQHFARWSRAREALDQKPLQVVARLVFDSRQDLVSSGVRAADEADETGIVHLAYSSEVGDLLLDVYPLPTGRVRIDGEMLLAQLGAPIFDVHVQGTDASGADFEIRTVDGDETGRFSLLDVPAGACRLRASNGQVNVMADLRLDLIDRS